MPYFQQIIESTNIEKDYLESPQTPTPGKLRDPNNLSEYKNFKDEYIHVKAEKYHLWVKHTLGLISP